MGNLILETIDAALLEHGENNLRDERTTTYGGQWAGACLLCKKAGHAAGKDRFLVWPAREVDGGGSRAEPCYWCRQCKKSGDLIQFVREVYGLSFQEARIRLGLETRGAFSRTSVGLKVRVASATGAPDDVWQRQALRVIEEAHTMLWSEQGAGWRAYLATRGINEDTARKYVLGCIPKDRYEDGVLWGCSGKVWIPRGILFAEYHSVIKEGIAHREIWSLFVRRNDDDRLFAAIEQDVDPDVISRYHFVKGSQKGLYLGDSIVSGKPAVLVEGPFCALSLAQEAGDIVGVGATMSAVGCRNLTWINKMVFPDFVLIGMDADRAGQDAYAYWKDAIPQGKSLPWRYRDDDYNGKHAHGEDIRSFIEKGIAFYRSMTTPSVQRHAIVSLVDTPLIVTETVTAKEEKQGQTSVRNISNFARTAPTECRVPETETITQYANASLSNRISAPQNEEALLDQQIEDIFARGCAKQLGNQRCEAAVDAIGRDGHGYCERHAPDALDACFVCGQPSATYTVGTIRLCVSEFAAYHLLRQGEALSWEPLLFSEGNGCISAVHQLWKHAEGGRVPGGQRGYLSYIQNAPREQIWLAVECASALVHERTYGVTPGRKRREKTVPKRIEEPCSRAPGGCVHDWRYPVQVLFHQKVDGQGRPVYGQYRDAPWNGVAHYIGTTRFTWCGGCILCRHILLFGECYNFPALAGLFAQGQDRWIEAVTHFDAYSVTFVLSTLQYRYKEKWNAVQGMIYSEE